jgi:hypothetical protein
LEGERHSDLLLLQAELVGEAVGKGAEELLKLRACHGREGDLDVMDCRAGTDAPSFDSAEEVER